MNVKVDEFRGHRRGSIVRYEVNLQRLSLEPLEPRRSRLRLAQPRRAGHHPRGLQTLGILLFDGVEVLDFAGPFEVFSTANRLLERDGGLPLFSILTLATRLWPVATRGSLSVNPAHDLLHHPPLDILVVPGGDVSLPMSDHELLEWLGKTSAGCIMCASVGTGAFLLGRAGLLRQKRVTTNFEDQSALREAFPEAVLETESRFVRDGKLWTSAGTSAGIDLSLALLSSLHGANLESRVRREVECRPTNPSA